MSFTGVAIGLLSFIIIGIFHPIVIKAEYYIGKKIWPAFLVAGAVFIAISILISNLILSISLSIVGFCCLWSIGELFEQEERVKKGWFPSNPKKDKSKSA